MNDFATQEWRILRSGRLAGERLIGRRHFFNIVIYKSVFFQATFGIFITEKTIRFSVSAK